MSKEHIKSHARQYTWVAMLYLAGILLLAGRSVIRQRHMLSESMENSLAAAVVALKEIVITDDAADRILSGSTNAPAYLLYQEKLHHFVQNSPVAAAGIAALHTHETYTLRAEDEESVPALSTDTWPHILLESIRQQLDARLDEPIGQPIAFPLRISERATLRIVASPTQNKEGTLLIYYSGALENPERMLEYILTEASMIMLCISMLAILIAIGNQSKKSSVKELIARNNTLSQNLETLHLREKKLMDLIHDNDRFNAVTIGREERIIQLKAEVNSLLAKMHQEKRYHVDKID